MTEMERKTLQCVKKAMRKVKCTNPQKFFQDAIEAKTTPRKFNLEAEVENFFRLERGEWIKIPHEIHRVIVAHAEEINLQRDSHERFDHFSKSVRTAWCSSGRMA